MFQGQAPRDQGPNENMEGDQCILSAVGRKTEARTWVKGLFVNMCSIINTF